MEEKNITKKIIEEVEKLEKAMLDKGIKAENLDTLNKISNIHKNLSKVEHYEKEEEDMRYRGYSEGTMGNYNEGYGEYSYGRRGVPGTGRYRESGSYGRRGVKGTGRGRYRGEEMMDEMAYHYGNYNEGIEQYGADEETMKSFKYMLKSFKDYYKHLKEEASSQQEVKMLEDVAREISEM